MCPAQPALVVSRSQGLGGSATNAPKTPTLHEPEAKFVSVHVLPRGKDREEEEGARSIRDDLTETLATRFD